MKETLSFKVDSRIKAAILELATKENRSLSNYVVTVLMRHLEIKGVKWRSAAGGLSTEENTWKQFGKSK